MKARSAARSTAFALAVCSMCSFATGAGAQQDETGTETETETAPPKPHRRTASETDTPPASEVGPPPAAAKAPPSGIVLANINGWEISIDGRLNAFVVYGFGNHNASTAPETGNSITPGIGTGITADNQIDVNGNFRTPRIRSGFVPNILAFNFSEERVGVDRPFRSRRALVGHPFERLGLHQRADVCARGLPQARRPLGQLHGRRASLPSSTAGPSRSTSTTATTTGWDGRATSTVFFRRAARSATARFPLLPRGPRVRDAFAGRLSVHGRRVDPDDPGRKVGAFDHAHVRGRGGLHPELRPGHVQGVRERRVAATRRRGELRRPDADQSQPSPDNRAIATKTVDQLGIAGGLRLELGPLRLGVTGHYGPGLGFYYAQENSQVAVYFAADVFDPRDGDLRTFRGFYGQLALVLGKVMIAGGAGASQVLRLPSTTRPRTRCPAEPRDQRRFQLPHL